jgi:hypothetical protein
VSGVDELDQRDVAAAEELEALQVAGRRWEQRVVGAVESRTGSLMVGSIR